MAKKKAIKKINDPEVTLVWTFRGHNIFITGSEFDAKEYSDMVTLGLSSIWILQSMKDEQDQILLNKLPKKDERTRKTKTA